MTPYLNTVIAHVDGNISNDRYTFGISIVFKLMPLNIKNILQKTVKKGRGGRVDAYEVGLNTEEDGVILPCGNSGIWIND